MSAEARDDLPLQWLSVVDVVELKQNLEAALSRALVAERKIANARRWLRAKQHVKAYEALGRWPR